MGKIVANLFVSVDGVMEAPQNWHFPYFNDEMTEVVAAQMAEAETMLLGRRTYEEFAASWPNRGSDIELADVINTAPKLVASRSLTAVDWQNSTLIEGDVADDLRRRKQASDGIISITGSAELVRSLLRAGVLDELRLLVHPIVVGTGKRLFEDGGDRVPLKLVDSRTFQTGVLYLTYVPADR